MFSKFLEDTYKILYRLDYKKEEFIPNNENEEMYSFIKINKKIV